MLLRLPCITLVSRWKPFLVNQLLHKPLGFSLMIGKLLNLLTHRAGNEALFIGILGSDPFFDEVPFMGSVPCVLRPFRDHRDVMHQRRGITSNGAR